MADTSIEWASKVWNPTTGCDKVSAGCDNCYALTMAARLRGMGSAKYQTDGDPRTSGPGFGLAVHPDALTIPLRWRKPQRVFVNSMSDLFHPKVPAEFIARVFAVMVAAPHHTFKVLTKRAPRMRATLADDTFWTAVSAELAQLWNVAQPPAPLRFAPPWIWLGVSVEDQEQAGRRIPALLDTAAGIRWLSCEPLLGPIDLTPWAEHLDWVVVGGESGPQARPMEPGWARSLRDQCRAGRVPFFFKQAGAVLAREWGCTDRKGHTPAEWPEPFPRQYPDTKVAA